MKQLVLLFTLLCTSAAISQNSYQTHKSEIFKDSNKESYIVYVKEDGQGGFYMVRMFKASLIAAPSGYYMEHYDANLKLIKEFEYAPEYHAFEKYKTLLGVVSSGDELHLIDIQYNVKEKAYLCIARSTNINTFEFKDKELFRLDRKEADKVGSLRLDEIFFDATSGTLNDDSVAAFIKDNAETSFAIALNLKSKEAKTLKLYSFDNNLNKKLEHTYVRDVKNKHYNFKNIEITDNGNTMYMLGSANLKDDNTKAYTYELVRLTPEGETVEQFKNEKPYKETLRMFRRNDKLVLTGFYTEPKGNWYNGVSYFEIDPQSLKLEKIKHHAFNNEWVEDKERGFFSPESPRMLIFKKIDVAGNGDIIINAEEFYIVSNNNYSMPIMGDIISARIDASGNLVWASNIKKGQPMDNNAPYVSYTYALKDDVVTYFINTSENVKKLKSGSVVFRGTGKNRSDFTVVTVDNKGTMNYRKLLDDDVNEVPFMTANGVVLSDKIFFLGRRGSKKQLLKVQL